MYIHIFKKKIELFFPN